MEAKKQHGHLLSLSGGGSSKKDDELLNGAVQNGSDTFTGRK